MEERRALYLAQSGGQPPTPTIGGLVVYSNNCYFASGNGLVTNVTENNDYFLTGVIDTGSTGQKAYTITRMGTPKNALIRFYNDITASSIDYWTILRTDLPSGSVTTYDFNSAGRYVVISIYKTLAADFYLKNRVTGEYIIKGSNVT